MTVEVIPIRGLPDVRPGDDLPGLILAGLRAGKLTLQDGDVVAVTQKVVSKSEGRVVPEGPDGKEAWVRRESRRVVASRGDIVIAETRHGFVCANAGVDASNVAEGLLTLLPEDPDGSAERIRTALGEATGADVAVLITDTFGRPWRSGVVNVAIGCAGLPALVDLRGTKDGLGRVLEMTVVAVADEVAAASGLAMGKSDGIPAAVVRGVRAEARASPASALVRPPGEDLFRTSPLQAIQDRVDATVFSERDVPRHVVGEATTAALKAPPRAGRESVVFIDVDSAPARRPILRAADARARAALGEAPVVVVPFIRLRPGLRGPERDGRLAAGGAAVQNLLLALSAQGLASSWLPVERFDQPALATALGVPDGVALGAVIAGWPLPAP
jgi:coenzyme F420-0:L-glutamate ligase/coenzyme F420-1:gamma-L-glutamate ligase